MANGLQIVSIRIPSIEQSAIGNSVVYYDEQSPLSIANAILSVKIGDKDASREIVSMLDHKFVKDMEAFLGIDV